MDSLSPRKFGIELEISRRLVCINYKDKKKNGTWTRIQGDLLALSGEGKIANGWKLKTDTSCGGELVSPPMVAPFGLQQIGTIANYIKALSKEVGKPLVDGECGLHLHFDASDMTPQRLGNLFVILHMAEPILFSMYPARNFEYCAPIDVNMRLASRFRDWVDVRDTWYRGTNNIKNKNMTYKTQFINGTSPGDYYDGTRYHGFNIHCYWRQGTVEFRYGNGTFDLNHIKAYYEMCLAMMNTAIKSKRLKLDESIKNLSYPHLVSFYNKNYRFRKYLKQLCNLCGFSRDTIKLMITQIKENNVRLLKKDPSLIPTVITDDNKDDYIYVDAKTGMRFNWRGERNNVLLRADSDIDKKKKKVNKRAILVDVKHIRVEGDASIVACFKPVKKQVTLKTNLYIREDKKKKSKSKYANFDTIVSSNTTNSSNGFYVPNSANTEITF